MNRVARAFMASLTASLAACPVPPPADEPASTGTTGSSSTTGQDTDPPTSPNDTGASDSPTSTSSNDDTGAADTTTGEPMDRPEMIYPGCGWKAVPLFEMPSHSYQMVAGDFDGDDIPEVITLHYPGMPASSMLTLWSQDGQLAFTAAASRVVGLVDDFTAAEVDDQPGLELVLHGLVDVDPGDTQRQAHVYRFAGPSFSAPVVTVFEEGGFSLQALDVDDDARADLVLQHGYPATVETRRSVGDGTFMPAKLVETHGCYTSAVAVADADHDGTSDLLTLGDCNSPIEDPSLVMHAGGPDGFGPPVVVGSAVGSNHALWIGRFDAAPPADVLLVSDDIAYHIAPGVEAGGFDPPWTFPFMNAYVNTVGDLDGDGLDDIFGFSLWLRNTGVGFEACDLGATVVQVLDLDGDGALDGLALDGATAVALLRP